MIKPMKEISRLTLNAFDFLECLPTKTTAMPEAAAANNARVMPIIALEEALWGIKANSFELALSLDATGEFGNSGINA